MIFVESTLNLEQNCSFIGNIPEIGTCEGLNQRIISKRNVFSNFGCKIDEVFHKNKCLECIEENFDSLNMKIETCPSNSYYGYFHCYETKTPFRFQCSSNSICQDGKCIEQDLKTCHNHIKYISWNEIDIKLHQRDILIGFNFKCSSFIYDLIIILILTLLLIFNSLFRIFI